MRIKVAPRIEWARSECEAPSVGKPRNATIQIDLRQIRPVKARFAQGLDSAVLRVCIKP